MNVNSTPFARPPREQPFRPPQTTTLDDGRIAIRPIEAMRARDPMIFFAYACLRHELDALLALKPAPDAVLEPDTIHRMRIATRRLRVALRSFASMLPPKRARKLAKGFRWLGRRLGEARDLDVHAETVREYSSLVPPQQQPELGRYVQHLRHARTEARDELDELFLHPRVTALLTSLRELLEAGPPAAARRRWRSFRIADGAAKYLRKSRRRVLRAGRKIDADTPPEKLHRLRIRAKRLRYELEFFAEVFPKLEPAIKATKQLQDVLGEHQDACTAAERLRDYARGHADEPLTVASSAADPTALERLLTTQEGRAADARARFAAEWRRFERVIGKLKLRKLAA